MEKDSKAEEIVEPENKQEPVDLSALDGFDFGTSWSPTTTPSESPRGKDRRSPRGDREGKFSGGQAERKDRRGFKPGNFKKEPFKDSYAGQERPRRSGPNHGSRQGSRPVIPRKVVEVSFYAEDNGFKALCKALKISTITYELFDIARTILEKNERFYVIVRRDNGSKDTEKIDENLYVSGTDNLPFLDEEGAKRHALSNYLEHFFTTDITKVEPPSGSFSSVQKCGFTGELLGPPNYHRIKKIMEAHHSSRLSDMPYSKFESRVESVKDEEVIAEWLEEMKTQTTYTLKPEFGESRTFEDSFTARSFVSATLGDKLVKAVSSVRLEGTEITNVRDFLIKANLEFAWERQKRFPLDTANLLRGWLRRERLALYKKGAKGVTYVCAVKRRFREKEQVFSEPLQKLIQFLEENSKIFVKDLPEKYLGFSVHPSDGETLELSDDQQKQLKSLNLDFNWLLKEGYIAEYSDGTVLLHPVVHSSSVKSKGKASVGKSIDDAMEGAESTTLSEEDNKSLQKKVDEELSAEELAASKNDRSAREAGEKPEVAEDSIKTASTITLSNNENSKLADQAESEVSESAQISADDEVDEEALAKKGDQSESKEMAAQLKVADSEIEEPAKS